MQQALVNEIQGCSGKSPVCDGLGVGVGCQVGLGPGLPVGLGVPAHHTTNAMLRNFQSKS